MRKKKYLKGCPFCGKDKIEEQEDWTKMIHRIECVSCGGEGPPGYTMLKARRLWNKRVRSD